MVDIILVLGNHRSGTSTITNLVQNGGYYLGKDVDMTKNIHNKDGYFENKKLYDLHENILHSINSNYYDINQYNQNQIDTIMSYETTLQRLLIDQFGNKKKIAIKDPRICFILDLYVKVIKNLNWNLKIIYCHRYIDDSALSLSIVQKIDINRCRQLYIKHKKLTKIAIKKYNIPILVIVYEKLNTIREIERIKEFIGCDYLQSIFKKELHHYNTNRFYEYTVSYWVGNDDNIIRLIDILTKLKMKTLLIINVRSEKDYEYLRLYETISCHIEIIYG